MKILGIRIGWPHSGRRRRKKVPTKQENMYNATLLDAALKSPGVLAVVIDKFGKLPAYQEDELEPIIINIRDKMHKKAVQTILKNRRRELVIRIDTIIDEVIGADDRSGKQYKKRPTAGVDTDGQCIAPGTIYQSRTMGRGLKQGLNLLTFLQSLEVITFLGKLAKQQRKYNTRSATKRIYVVEENEQTVELSGKEYLGYFLQQQLRQGKKSMTPQLDVTQQPGVTGADKIIEGLPNENEEGVTGIES